MTKFTDINGNPIKEGFYRSDRHTTGAPSINSPLVYVYQDNESQGVWKVDKPDNEDPKKLTGIMQVHCTGCI